MEKVLITDDNEINRYLLEAIFTGNGYIAILAINGAEALEFARNEPPNIIITDLLMPIMDGFELCRQWKSDSRLKNIPFIVYTATYTEPKDEQLILSLGADKFIIKPQEPEILLKIVRDTLVGKNEIFIAQKPLGDEMERMKQYNEVLFYKLEQKVINIEKEIIEKNLTEQKLTKIIEALERSNVELEKFADATSHDLQEPMRVISLYMGRLKKTCKDKLSAEEMEYINIAINGAEHMSILTKGIISYSRVDGIEKDFKLIDLNKLSGEIMDVFRQQAEAIHAVISIGSLPTVWGNEIQLYQLFQNLIANSLKFSKKEYVPKLEITVLKKYNEWLFCFKDNGIGISPKYFNQIFVIFQTLHPKDEFGGNGIGLALCKKIVEFHGGKIWVESEEGHGATFYFTLPVA